MSDFIWRSLFDTQNLESEESEAEHSEVSSQYETEEEEDECSGSEVSFHFARPVIQSYRPVL